MHPSWPRLWFQEDYPPASMLRVLRMNAPEWWHMLIGCFCSLINGGVQPAFAIIFAEIIGVSMGRQNRLINTFSYRSVIRRSCFIMDSYTWVHVLWCPLFQVFALPNDEQKEEALFWSMMFIVIGVSSGLSMFLMCLMFGISGERLTLRLRDLVFRAYLKQVSGQLTL